jgi:diadenosine tetraphosphatase ApaH/serine/threonine PP2A family protein phosphatase
MSYPSLVPLVLKGKGPFAFIGDIHGCFDELYELVGKVAQMFGHGNYDQVTWISLGDVVDRGPRVHECFNFLRAIDAHWVLGNHDEKLVRYGKGNKVRIGPSQEVSIKSMKPEDFEYMTKKPVPFVRLPDCNILGVHGGFHAHIRPEAHDLRQIIRLRYIEPGTAKMYQLSDGDDKGKFWADVWGGPETVIFGHAWSKEPQWFPRALGIDTGCVYGNTLTAAVVHDTTGVLAIETVSVPAKKVYWEDHLGLEEK